ncbi:plectin-like [Eleutherodactylus coqui]|uniref:plectin-like n=1 Tax=Eleutherodactylus coqui TaxID=57060 RepID=UPI0034619C6D
MMQDADGRSSASSGAKMVPSDPDVLTLFKEFAEQKQKEREQNPEVKYMKNKYKLKAPAYPSPGNVLHTGRQLSRSPAPGVLPLLPSQKFDPRTEEDEEEFGLWSVRTPDNVVPCGRQLARTPTDAHALREMPVKEGEDNRSANKSERNVKDSEEGGMASRVGNGSVICDMAEGEMARRESGKSDTIVGDTEEGGMERRVGNGSVICDMAEGEMAKSDCDGNGSIICDTAEDEGARRQCNNGNGAISRVSNVMPGLMSASEGGLTTVQQETISEDTEFDSRTMIQNNRRISQMPVRGLNQMRISGVLKKMPGYECRSEDLEFLKYMENQEKSRALKEAISEDPEARSRPMMQNSRRISEMPVQGLNQIRISGVLKKMPGYECRSEDLEFLKYMENREKAKVLKKELLTLRKDLAARNQEKESVLAKKEKIEADIEKMNLSLERTLQLGRALLSRTQDPAGDLSPEEVFKQLHVLTIQNAHQQARLQLEATERELSRRRQEAANRTSLADNRKRSLTLKLESSEQHVKEAQYRVQQLQEEVVTLKMQIKQTVDQKSELEARLQKARLQISDCGKRKTQKSEMSEEEREKMNRRLQRILHRKDNYLERERILQRLKEELQ